MIIDEIKYQNLFGNGRNKILKSLIDSEKFLSNIMPYHKRLLKKELDRIDMYEYLKDIINRINNHYGNLLEGFYLADDKYVLDNLSICEDGDITCVRYRNVKDNKIYKMKTSKFFHKCTKNLGWIPETALHWLAEVVAEKRKANVQTDNFILKYGNTLEDFFTIYSETKSNHSCMTGGEHISFYLNCVDATAAWLEDTEGNLKARCIIFNDVSDELGNKYRLAERQYSDKDFLSEVLITKLINAKLIDGYKKIGAGAGDKTLFITNDGKSLHDELLSIPCDIRNGDIISYQDSFVYYNVVNKIASNKPNIIKLDCTDLRCSIKDEKTEYLVYIQGKRIPVTYHDIPEDSFEYDDKKYIGNYCIINGRKVPLENVIIQYSKNNEFIAMYECIYDAEKALNKRNAYLSIYKCLLGKQKTAYKYIWKYKKDENK